MRLICECAEQLHHDAGGDLFERAAESHSVWHVVESQAPDVRSPRELLQIAS